MPHNNIQSLQGSCFAFTYALGKSYSINTVYIPILQYTTAMFWPFYERVPKVLTNLMLKFDYFS